MAVGLQKSRTGGDAPLPFIGRTTDKGRFRFRFRFRFETSVFLSNVVLAGSKGREPEVPESCWRTDGVAGVADKVCTNQAPMN